MIKKIPLLILFMILFSSLFIVTSALAADPVEFKPQVTIDDKFKYNPDPNVGITIGPNTIGEYISAIYKYAIGIVGILAVVVMMFGGLRWIMAAGNAEAVSSAKAWIMSAITGLIIALSSYVILYTVNPALVKFEPISPSITGGKTIGCCVLTSRDCFETADSEHCGSIGGSLELNRACTQFSECATNDVEGCQTVGQSCLAMPCCSSLDLTCVSGVCVGVTSDNACVGRENGIPCQNDADEDGYCRNEVCVLLGSVGGSCTAHWQCAGDNWCNSGTCAACIETGEDCSGVFANHECCNGDCTGLFSQSTCN